MNACTKIHGRRAVRMLASAALIGAAFSVACLGAAAAHAEDGQDTGFSVTIPEPAEPAPTPTPTPTAPPTTPPAAVTPPAAANTTKPTTTVKTPVKAATTPATTPTTAECTPAEPPVPTAPATTASSAAVDKDFYEPGQNVTATATGFAAGEQVQLVLFSEPTLIGTFSADATGQVEAVFPVDKKTTPGTHTVQFTGWCKKIAIADVLVGSGPLVAAGFDIPVGVWVAGGVGGAAVLGVAGWQLLGMMRAPGLGKLGV